MAAAFPGRVSAIAQARRDGRRVTAFDAWDPAGAGVRVVTGATVRGLRWVGGRTGGRCDGVVLDDVLKIELLDQIGSASTVLPDLPQKEGEGSGIGAKGGKGGPGSRFLGGRPAMAAIMPVAIAAIVLCSVALALASGLFILIQFRKHANSAPPRLKH